MSQWGIDVSGHQSGADLAKAKAAGCSFVFAKATEGLTWQDSTFAGFRGQASMLGLPFGAYHFAHPQAGRTGAQEANAFLGFYRYAARDLPPVLDLEDTALGNAATVAWALDWLAAVQKATGVRPIVYTGAYFATSRLSGGAALSAYDLWLASYTSRTPPAPAPWKSWRFWQHTSSATVPGIPGSVDRNITTQPLPGTIGGSFMASLTDAQQLEIYNKITGTDANSPATRGDANTIRKDIGNIRDQILAAVDPATLAAKIAGALPPGQPVDQTVLETAIRNVLGSLKPPA